MLDLSRNSGTALVPCAPCCHRTNLKYYGIGAVITPSYPDGIDYPFFYIGINQVYYTPIYYRTFNYAATSFILFILEENQNTIIYKTNNYFVDIPVNNTNYPNYPSFVSIPVFLKLVVVKNVSIDAYFSIDDIDYVKQNETFYGEYFSFVVEFSNLSAYANPIKIRFTINSGINSTPVYSSVNPTNYDYYAIFSNAGDYDGIYRNYVPIGDNNLPINNQNVITTNFIKYATGGMDPNYVSNANVTNKRIAKNQQSIDGAGYYIFPDILSGKQFDGGYIIYPVYNWFPLPPNPSSPYYNNIWGYEDGTPSDLTQVTALVDYRLPVTYVALPYFFKATVLFVKIYWPSNYPQIFDSTYNKLLSVSQVTITE